MMASTQREVTTSIHLMNPLCEDKVILVVVALECPNINKVDDSLLSDYQIVIK